ncbi:olfactory receptor 494-like [Rana temporaria]|uniref:olfactory receptor 494-like n=1 Tax=Rana temporaria TaxID=8407 RepID=UPI001AAD5634|nr:olfactory receptor 494-like [Rana temporaria]
MCEGNQTEVTEFLLLGFQGLYKFKIIFFILFLLSYMMILSGNLLITVLISTKEHLKIPMFYFLKHLAIADLMITTTISPMLLDITLKNEITISISVCIFQMYCFAIFGFVQCFLIVFISYDRYLAICNPMRYNSIMKPHICLNMVVGSYLLVFFLSSEMILVCQLHFCGDNKVDHFFCDSGPLIELSTSDTSILLLVDLSVSILGLFVPFSFIIVTYVLIVITIVNISSASGRWKAFSTCSSHLATVCSYYGTLMAVYMAPPDSNSSNANKFRSFLYIVVTPMVNPIIYSLRNHEIRKTLQRMFRNIKML